MRIIESKRNPQTGERYHYCPKTQGLANIADCEVCLGYRTRGFACSPEDGYIEQLPASYRVHCPFGEEVKAIIPSHCEDQIPQSWGTDKFALEKYSVIEPKLDGARCIMLITETGIRCFSRRNNRFGDQSEFTENVPHLANLRLPTLEGTILDGELICQPNRATASGNIPAGTLGATMAVVGSKSEQAIKTQEQSGWAHIYVFDMPKCKSEDWIERKWAERHAALHTLLVQQLSTEAQGYIHLMPFKLAHTVDQRRTFYQQFLVDGAEGCVLKDPLARYYDLRAMLKTKEDITLDVIVTGFEYGKVGSKYEDTIGTLLCSVKDVVTGKLVEVGKVIPGSDVVREELYQRIGLLTTEQIIERKIIIWLQAQNWTKEYRLRHSRILEYCQDRDIPTRVDFATIRRK